MSLQFRWTTAGLLVSLSLACASVTAPHVTTQPSIAAASADLFADVNIDIAAPAILRTLLELDTR